MDILNFKLLCENIDKHLNCTTNPNASCAVISHSLDIVNTAIPILLITEEERNNNVYLKCIGDICYWNKERKNGSNWPMGAKQENDFEAFNDVKQSIIEGICKDETKYYHKAMETIFWNLLVAFMDDQEEKQNKKKEIVVKLAHAFLFSTEMIEDWIETAKFVSCGHELSDNCNLSLKTKAGQSFFLHYCN